jgi:hypothetical protein
MKGLREGSFLVFIMEEKNRAAAGLKAWERVSDRSLEEV